jgi:hypothetical protein
VRRLVAFNVRGRVSHQFSALLGCGGHLLRFAGFKVRCICGCVSCQLSPFLGRDRRLLRLLGQQPGPLGGLL